MIPTRASADERHTMIQNILAAYESATPDQRQRGHAWYRNAHQLAEMLADGGDTARMAGMIAALSPQKSWSLNIKMTRQAIAGRKPGHLGDALNKLAAIMAGADPATVLPMDRKTGHFYRCIANPSDPDAVVIDRHAHDVAVGETYGTRDRGLSNATRYATLAHCYREAAQWRGILPSALQATCWVVWTERIAKVGNGQHRPALYQAGSTGSDRDSSA